MLNDVIVFTLYLVILLALAWPLSKYMTNVFTFEKTIFDPVFRPLEKCIYRLTGVNPEQDMKHGLELVIG